MRRTSWRAVSLVMALGLALASCSGPNRSDDPSSPSGFRIVLTANPNALRGATPGSGEAQGSCAIITAKVFDVNGELVDGAVVTMTTNLGRFPGAAPGQEFIAVGGVTNRGILTEVLCAKSERGTAIVTAVVQDAAARVLITIF
ncbi:MAG TPA: hypothetical protein VGW35_23295 [Methylomirabilota bacterium]|nr:hypothetical protein [Methylomirabilota bacterium]